MTSHRTNSSDHEGLEYMADHSSSGSAGFVYRETRRDEIETIIMEM